MLTAQVERAGEQDEQARQDDVAVAEAAVAAKLYRGHGGTLVRTCGG